MTTLLIVLILTPLKQVEARGLDSIIINQVTFLSEGESLSGTIYAPRHPQSAIVLVHGSGQESRMRQFAELLAQKGISVLTYDKRGVGESGGVYAGPEVGTNNISPDNLSLLAKDASAAVETLHKYNKKVPIGLLGFSQAGWIMPMTANINVLVQYMVLFSCPTVTTLEQLRFQFYTDGRADFWDNHTERDAREHIKNDPDRYQFVSTDPKSTLRSLSIPGLWLFGEKDIQIPVRLGIEHLNELKAQGKPFDYCLFPSLGHNTAFTDSTEPVDIAIQWINREIKKLETTTKPKK